MRCTDWVLDGRAPCVRAHACRDAHVHMRMCTHVRACAHTHTHTHTHTHAHTYTHVQAMDDVPTLMLKRGEVEDGVQVLNHGHHPVLVSVAGDGMGRKRLPMWLEVRLRECVRARACVRACMCACVRVHACVHVCVHECVCVGISRRRSKAGCSLSGCTGSRGVVSGVEKGQFEVRGVRGGVPSRMGR